MNSVCILTVIDNIDLIVSKERLALKIRNKADIGEKLLITTLRDYATKLKMTLTISNENTHDSFWLIHLNSDTNNEQYIFTLNLQNMTKNATEWQLWSDSKNDKFKEFTNGYIAFLIENHAQVIKVNK